MTKVPPSSPQQPKVRPDVPGASHRARLGSDAEVPREHTARHLGVRRLCEPRAPDGLLGVATPSIRATFVLAPEDIGELLISVTAGYLLSSFNSGLVVSRLGVGVLLALSCLLTSVSLLGYALASAWWMMLGFGVLSGLGAGAIDAGLNTWVATHFTARTVNWLHAFYGVGAATGPLVMTAVLAAGRPWRSGYAIVGVGQLVLAGGFAWTRQRWLAPCTAPGAVESAYAESAARRPCSLRRRRPPAPSRPCACRRSGSASRSSSSTPAPRQRRACGL